MSENVLVFYIFFNEILIVLYTFLGRTGWYYFRTIVGLITGLYILTGIEPAMDLLRWILINLPKIILDSISYFAVGYIVFNFDHLIRLQYWFRRQLKEFRLFWRRRGRFLWNVTLKRCLKKLWIHATNYCGYITVACIGLCYSLEVYKWLFYGINEITFVLRAFYISSFLFQILFYVETKRRKQADVNLAILNIYTSFAILGACVMFYSTTWKLIIALFMTKSYIALIYICYIMINKRMHMNCHNPQRIRRSKYISI